MLLLLSPEKTTVPFLQGSSNPLNSLWVIAIFLLIVLAAYFTSRFIATRAQSTGHRGLVQIVERVAISPTQSVLLLRVGQEAYLVGASKDSMVLLGIPQADILLDVSQTAPNSSPVTSAFGDIVAKARQHLGGKKEIWGQPVDLTEEERVKYEEMTRNLRGKNQDEEGDA